MLHMHVQLEVEWQRLHMLRLHAVACQICQVEVVAAAADQHLMTRSSTIATAGTTADGHGCTFACTYDAYAAQTHWPMQAREAVSVLR